MTSFTQRYRELWEKESQEKCESIRLSGLAHEEQNGRVELQWTPEYPTCAAESVARRVFGEALLMASNDVDETNAQPFAVIEPVMGHIAVKLFCDKPEFWRDVRQVAFIRPIIDHDKFIG